VPMMGREMELRGKIALVTGGGHRLGGAITDALADAGCVTVIHYGRSRQAAEAKVEQLRSRGSESICVGADLREEAQVAALFETVDKQHGRLDILVNSAATFEKAPLGELTASDWDQVMAVNLRAPFLCLRFAAPLMGACWEQDKVPAVVVNIGDLSGVLAWPGFAHHGASKAGLLHLTRVSARELAPAIRVNAVVPGPVLPPPGKGEQDEEFQSLVNRIPARRPGSPAEVGQAVVFLASNDFIFGETLCVDGGEHLVGAGHRQL
jgi:pteridine reductase